MELLRHYSNQAKLREKLQGLLLMERTRSSERGGTPRQVQTRLSTAQQAELAERYLSGARAY